MDWKNWNPTKLQTKISTPLKLQRKSSLPVDRVKENEEQKRTKQVKGKYKNSNTNDTFTRLADTKIELINLMLENAKEKHELEIEILKMQLQKEKLQVNIMQKEFELKKFVLERELSKNE